MDYYSPFWTHGTHKQCQAEMKLTCVSQHSFGFMHGFVVCILLKRLCKKNRDGVNIDKNSLSNDSSIQLTEKGTDKYRCVLWDTALEVKEETVSEVQPPDQPRKTPDRNVVERIVDKSHVSEATPIHSPAVDGGIDDDKDKHTCTSSFHLHLTETSKNDHIDSYPICGEPSGSKKAENYIPNSEAGSTISDLCWKGQLPLRSHHGKIPGKRWQNSLKKQSNSKSRTAGCTTDLAMSLSPPHTPFTENSSGDGVSLSDTSQPQQQQHVCSMCNKTFTTARSLKRHWTKIHECDSGLNVLTRKAMERPLQVHCDKCPKMYSGGRAERNLQQHVLAYHSEVRPVQCDVCNITLNNQHHLKLHKRSSHRKAVCYICGAHFVTQVGLQTHLLAHKGDKTFVCEICGAAFVRVSSLRQHTKFHADSRDFKCSMCPLSFKTFSSLSIHMMCVHQQGRYFNSQVEKIAKLGFEIDSERLQRVNNKQCVTCGQVLMNNTCNSHFSDCMLTFSCPQCQWATKDIQKFHKHLVRRSSTPTCAAAENERVNRQCAGLVEKNRPLVKDFICPSCGKCFYTQSHLQAHKQQHAEKRFSCPVCGKSFTYKFNMQNHLTTHTDARPFECQVCQKTFKMKSQLQLHQRYHDGEFTCEICGKVLTRKQHVLNHYRLVHPEKNLT